MHTFIARTNDAGVIEYVVGFADAGSFRAMWVTVEEMDAITIVSHLNGGPAPPSPWPSKTPPLSEVV